MTMMRGMTCDMHMSMMMGRPRQRSVGARRDCDRARQDRHTTFQKSHQINLLVDFS
jgi:hypothetical protein